MDIHTYMYMNMCVYTYMNTYIYGYTWIFTNMDMYKRTATHCNIYQHEVDGEQYDCNTLQHTATLCNCNTLQHTATHCNTLQLQQYATATHCNIYHHAVAGGQYHCSQRAQQVCLHPPQTLHILCMSHVIWVMSHMYESCHTCIWAMSHMHESCHTCIWAMSHIYI